MVGRWRRGHSPNLFWKFRDDFIDVRNHIKRYTARASEIEVHAKVIMLVTPGGFEGFVWSLIPVLEPGDEICNRGRILMTDQEIIHVPAYCHLVAIDHFVGHTWIIGVKSESNGAKVSN